VFAFSGEAKPKKYATEVVFECHEAWKKLIKGETQPGDIALQNSSVQGSKGFTSDQSQLPKANPLPPAPIDGSISKSFFISSAQS
jgi:inorganic pyrophosphatase